MFLLGMKLSNTFHLHLHFNNSAKKLITSVLRREKRSTFVNFLCYTLDIFLNFNDLYFRYSCFSHLYKQIQDSEGVDTFTTAYNSYGLHFNDDGSIFWREWIPDVKEVFLRGDFSSLSVYSKKLNSFIDYPVFQITGRKENFLSKRKTLENGNSEFQLNETDL